MLIVGHHRGAAQASFGDFALLFLENRGPSGVISSQRYTLTPTGHRASVVEHDGSRVDYTYDALDRLTREAITDAVLGDRTFDYTYDAVGNTE